MASIPPRARLLATVIAAVACLFANRIVPLSLALLAVVILIFRAGIARAFLKFAAGVLAPTALMLLLVWGVIIGAPPGAPFHTDRLGALHYAGVIALCLSVLGGIIQLSLLSIPPRLLPATFRGWGLRGEGMVVALGVFAIGPELLLRSEQIMTARKARGVAQPGRIGRVREIARLLRPLFVWSIRSAVQRSEAWHQRAILLKVDQLPLADEEYSPAAGYAAVALALLWLTASIVWRWLP